jgi:thioredoxin reductase
MKSSLNNFDVIIVGGSYAGLAAAMALGRALRKVLIIDNGKPCNRQTPHTHNFLTNDGKTPSEISTIARSQLKQYETVKFLTGTAATAKQLPYGFEINTDTGDRFTATKLVFATGIEDKLPDIGELAACWGISVIHCPYCHGYEVRSQKTGVLGNGEAGYDFLRMISGWTSDLTLLTNGPSTLSAEQQRKLQERDVEVIEKEIERVEHADGHLQKAVFKDGTKISLDALYAPSPFEQHCKLPEALGCELTEEGYIKIDGFLETTVEGVYAIGDNASRMRTVANAVAMGTTAGMVISKKIIVEAF